MALVLVVDDEVAIAKLLDDVLSDEGHRVLVAGNGRQALDIAFREKPAIVLTDFMMPVMDGATFVRALADDDDLKDVPIILMSSMPEETAAERCPRYAAFVRKPFRIFDIVDTVAALLAEGQEPPPAP